MNRRDDIAAYLLGELDPAEAERLRAREASEPEFAERVARMRGLVARLETLDGEEWDPPAPPPLRAVPERRRRRWPSGPLVLRPALAALAAVALLAIGVAAGLLIDRGGSDNAGRRVALAPVGSDAPRAHAVARLNGATLHLTVTGLPRSRAGDFYEVWMLRSPTDLVAMGSFKVGADGRARVDLPITASASQFPILDVSLEPADGNPAHSGDSVLRSKPLVS
jgi:anti-sigma-K factor RskA